MTESDFDDASETLEAIAVVRKHLASGWISDGCREEQSFGCVSCRALRVDDDLRLLEEYLRDDIAASAKV